MSPPSAGVYDFETLSSHGKPAHLSAQRGKVPLIFRTASRCGFTSQFEGLEALRRTYRDQGRVFVGFLSNEFGDRDRGTDGEIAPFCPLNCGASFPMMGKVRVNCGAAHPPWVWRTREAPGVLESRSVKWDFTEFLGARDDRVRKGCASTDAPESMAAGIEAARAA